MTQGWGGVVNDQWQNRLSRFSINDVCCASLLEPPHISAVGVKTSNKKF